MSWYDRVYLPLISAISWSDLLRGFPGRTEADLYLWIMDHRHYLTEQAGHDPGAEEAVLNYAIRFGPRKLQRLLKKRKVSLEERDFMQWSGLHRLRHGATVTLSDAANYQLLRQHINDHRYFLGEAQAREISVEEAAASWYDHVYHAVVTALEEQRSHVFFRKQTPADLYLRVMDYLSSLNEQGVELDVRGAAEDYVRLYGEAKGWGLVHALLWATRTVCSVLKPRPA